MDMALADIVGVTDENPRTIEKAWGYEHILPCEGHTVKVMEVKPGFQCSLHFHRVKHEAFVLVQGSLYVEFYEADGTKTAHLLTKPLSTLILPACTPHTFYVPKEQQHTSIFIESSTTDDPNDNYRLTKSGMHV